MIFGAGALLLLSSPGGPKVILPRLGKSDGGGAAELEPGVPRTSTYLLRAEPARLLLLRNGGGAGDVVRDEGTE